MRCVVLPNDLLLSVSQLNVCVGDRPLLTDVSFDLRKGQMLCIIGESGAGKSTLIKALQGMMPATCARFVYSPARIDIGGPMPAQLGLPQARWVMQDPLAALNPRQTLGRSIAESLYQERLSKADLRRRVLHALTDVELPETFYDRKPAQVSLGQAQRACLARALIAQPQLIFFDEPLSALDALVQKKIALRMDLLRRASDTTFIAVTHDLGFAAAYADQILVLKDGSVSAYQSRKAFFDAPESGYAQELVRAAQSLGVLAEVAA
jgi:peptide/nickel transport system ATP-binding protein